MTERSEQAEVLFYFWFLNARHASLHPLGLCGHAFRMLIYPGTNWNPVFPGCGTRNCIITFTSRHRGLIIMPAHLNVLWLDYTSAEPVRPQLPCEYYNVSAEPFNPLTAGAEYFGFFTQLSPHLVPPFKHIIKAIMGHQSARFEKNWPPFCQIWIIFTHLKLWIASARHNFKWVKISIE